MRLFGTIPQTNAPLEDGYLVTFALARLAIQVLTVRHKPEHRSSHVSLKVKPGPWNTMLSQIWPTKPPIFWPPARSFSEEAFRNCASDLRTHPSRRRGRRPRPGLHPGVRVIDHLQFIPLCHVQWVDEDDLVPGVIQLE